MNPQDIQIRWLNEDTGNWEPLDPKTNATIVEMGDGTSLETTMGKKANTADVYTKTQVYQKTETYNKTETDDLISAIENIEIVVSETEPTGNETFWFELL